jgi:hypothetical protein
MTSPPALSRSNSSQVSVPDEDRQSDDVGLAHTQSNPWQVFEPSERSISSETTPPAGQSQVFEAEHGFRLDSNAGHHRLGSLEPLLSPTSRLEDLTDTAETFSYNPSNDFDTIRSVSPAAASDRKEAYEEQEQGEGPRSEWEPVAGQLGDGDPFRNFHKLNLHPTHGRLSVRDQLGVLVILFLTIGTAVILAATGALCFLWSANEHNSMWIRIVLNGWITNAVNICADILKLAVGLQIGAVVAMLASLALESCSVLFPQAATLSVMKVSAGSATVVIMAWLSLRDLFSARSGASVGYFVLTVLSLAVYIVTQFMAILLISDIKLGLVPGVANPVISAYGFNSSSHDPASTYTSPYLTWTRRPGFYPTFAEYSEPSTTNEDMRDTGRTLRAFLPLQNAAQREMLIAFSGNTTILDSRVTCVRPNFTDLIVFETVPSPTGSNEPVTSFGEGPSAKGPSAMSSNITSSNVTAPSTFYRLSRLVGPPSHMLQPMQTPRMLNATTAKGLNTSFSSLMPLDCSFLKYNEFLDAEPGVEWPVSICQLSVKPILNKDSSWVQYSTLISEFLEHPNWTSQNYNTNAYGVAYLVLNYTRGETLCSNCNSSDAFGYSPRGEWLEFSFGIPGTERINATLCYAAFAQADMPVNISSDSNRTEFVLSNDNSGPLSSFANLRSQYGQDGRKSSADRGILDLHNRSWFATSEQLPYQGDDSYLRRFARTSIKAPSRRNTFEFTVPDSSNVSLAMYSNPHPPDAWENWIDVDATHKALFQEIMLSGGSMPFALQTLITLLSSMTYYDNIGYFDVNDTAHHTYLVLQNVPIGWYGLATVGATLAMHIVLVVVVICLFLAKTRTSRLGAAWAALAQGSSGDAAKYLAGAELLDDDTIARRMAVQREDRILVGTRLVDGKLGVHARKKVQ